MLQSRIRKWTSMPMLPIRLPLIMLSTRLLPASTYRLCLQRCQIYCHYYWCKLHYSFYCYGPAYHVMLWACQDSSSSQPCEPHHVCLSFWSLDQLVLPWAYILLHFSFSSSLSGLFNNYFYKPTTQGNHNAIFSVHSDIDAHLLCVSYISTLFLTPQNFT